MVPLPRYLTTPKAIVSHLIWLVIIVVLLGVVIVSNFKASSLDSALADIRLEAQTLDQEVLSLEDQLVSVSAALAELEQQDQRQINLELEQRITEVEKTYQQSVEIYEALVRLKEQTKDTATLDAQYAKIVSLLAEANYASASAEMAQLDKDMATTLAKLETQATIPSSVPTSNQPPSAGYQRQQVATTLGNYMVSLVAADLNTIRVVASTASDGDCLDNCPVTSLADHVAKSGGYAGVNGPYFCPADYPSCAGKTNSFDTLLMNRNKVYFNSDNNVYSTVPAVIFSGNSARFVGRSSEWGRDTGVDAVIANQPLLVSGGSVVFGSDGDPKKGSKGSRGFVGTSGSTVYIGVVHSATVAEAAVALQALGLQHALNLDGGGSTALWDGGYKVGPGRALPVAVVLVRK